jgi:hypothetical protein
MAPAVHDEGGLPGYGTVPADNEPVPDEVEMIEDIVEEPFGPFRVVVIGVVANDHIGAGGEILDEAHLRKAFHGVP